jgi:hypothetical protein
LKDIEEDAQKPLFPKPPPRTSVSITGEFSADFDPKNMISTCIKDFSWKKIPIFSRFQKTNKCKSPDFMISSSM